MSAEQDSEAAFSVAVLPLLRWLVDWIYVDPIEGLSALETEEVVLLGEAAAAAALHCPTAATAHLLGRVTATFDRVVATRTNQSRGELLAAPRAGDVLPS